MAVMILMAFRSGFRRTFALKLRIKFEGILIVADWDSNDRITFHATHLRCDYCSKIAFATAIFDLQSFLFVRDRKLAARFTVNRP